MFVDIKPSQKVRFLVARGSTQRKTSSNCRPRFRTTADQKMHARLWVVLLWCYLQIKSKVGGGGVETVYIIGTECYHYIFKLQNSKQGQMIQVIKNIQLE